MGATGFEYRLVRGVPAKKTRVEDDDGQLLFEVHDKGSQSAKWVTWNAVPEVAKIAFRKRYPCVDDEEEEAARLREAWFAPGDEDWTADLCKRPDDEYVPPQLARRRASSSSKPRASSKTGKKRSVWTSQSGHRAKNAGRRKSEADASRAPKRAKDDSREPVPMESASLLDAQRLEEEIEDSHADQVDSKEAMDEFPSIPEGRFQASVAEFARLVSPEALRQLCCAVCGQDAPQLQSSVLASAALGSSAHVTTYLLDERLPNSDPDIQELPDDIKEAIQEQLVDLSPASTQLPAEETTYFPGQAHWINHRSLAKAGLDLVARTINICSECSVDLADGLPGIIAREWPRTRSNPA
jgi:hypothetical protein